MTGNVPEFFNFLAMRTITVSNKNARSSRKVITETLQEGDFLLLNDPNIPTYTSHNGKSTIHGNY